MKTLFLICSNPAVAFTQQEHLVAFKVKPRLWHTGYTWLPSYSEWPGKERMQNRVGVTERHT